MKILEKRIEQMDVSNNIGSLPKRISSNYGSYTAEQWKNWTLIYSVFALKGVIEDKHLPCWQTFVLACKYFCRNTVTTADLQRADLHILKFCKQFEKLYRKKAITPKMHLHCHLKDIIMDYGPVHSFWCFSFERYNGIMGSVSTNKQSLELQLIRKLILLYFLDNIQLPLQYRAEFQDLIHNPFSTNFNSSSVSTAFTLHNKATTILVDEVDWSDLAHVVLPSNYKMQSL